MPQTSVQLEPGGGLFLFTDGLVERRTESIAVGLERLRLALEGAPTVEAMVTRGLRASGDQVADDVAAIVVARR